MIHIDATFEDIRILARMTTMEDPEAEEQKNWNVEFIDNVSGNSRIIDMTHDTLAMVLQILIHPDGEPEGVDDMYQVLEQIFAGWPQELRPIP